MRSSQLPKNLDRWSFEFIKQLCQSGEGESDQHDFKLQLNNRDKGATVKLTKACCAFANSNGGFLIYGVEDKEYNIIGLDEDLEFKKHFGDKLKAVPSIYYDTKSIKIPNSEKFLYVVFIPQSQSRPHVFQNKEQAPFWKRTNRGCEHMDLNEIREQFMDNERQWGSLRLLALELEDCERTLRILNNPIDVDNFHAVFEPEVLSSLVSEVMPLLRHYSEIPKDLFRLRRCLRTIESNRQVVISQMPTGGLRDEWGRAIHQDAASEVNEALGIIEKTFEKLQEHFGLTRNLE